MTYSAQKPYNRFGPPGGKTPFDYLRFAYDQPGNDPLSFEMLEGLQVGDNLTWSVQGARKLGEYLQLTLGYQGRKSPQGPIVHMGNAQIRAFF